jgi:hypothetical protein
MYVNVSVNPAPLNLCGSRYVTLCPLAGTLTVPWKFEEDEKAEIT